MFEPLAIPIPFFLQGLPLHMDMFSIHLWSRLHGTQARHWGCILGVLHHLLHQLLTKFKLGVCRFVLCPSPRLHHIHLSDQTQEHVLPNSQPLHLPTLLQSNGIMMTIVYIIHPMLGLAVPTDGLGVLEGLPLPINLPPSQMVLHHLKHAMSQHDLQHILGVTAAVDLKLNVIVLCNMGHALPQLILIEVPINDYPQHSAELIPPLLDACLKLDATLVALDYTFMDTEPIAPTTIFPFPWIGFIVSNIVIVILS